MRFLNTESVGRLDQPFAARDGAVYHHRSQLMSPIDPLRHSLVNRVVSLKYAWRFLIYYFRTYREETCKVLL